MNGSKKKIQKRPANNRNGKVHLIISQWEEVKWRWIKDDTITFLILSKEYGVTEQDVKMRSSKEDWKSQKKNYQDSLAKNIRVRIIEYFTEAGLPPKKLIALIAQRAVHSTKLASVSRIIYPKKMVKDKNGNLKKVDGRPMTVSESVEAEDNRTMLDYCELASKMMDILPTPRGAIKIDSPEDEDGNVPTLNLTFSEVTKKSK